MEIFPLKIALPPLGLHLHKTVYYFAHTFSVSGLIIYKTRISTRNVTSRSNMKGIKTVKRQRAIKMIKKLYSVVSSKYSMWGSKHSTKTKKKKKKETSFRTEVTRLDTLDYYTIRV